jgi:hypothetical protein
VKRRAGNERDLLNNTLQQPPRTQATRPHVPAFVFLHEQAQHVHVPWRVWQRERSARIGYERDVADGREAVWDRVQRQCGREAGHDDASVGLSRELCILCDWNDSAAGSVGEVEPAESNEAGAGARKDVGVRGTVGIGTSSRRTMGFGGWFMNHGFDG